MSKMIPLQTFVRGFLRDHLGYSKILAHQTSELFMERWSTAKQDGTMKRYEEQMDDVHTLARIFDTKAIANTDSVLGVSKKTKADIVKGEMHLEQQDKPEWLHGVRVSFRFPNRPVIDDKPRHFDRAGLAHVERPVFDPTQRNKSAGA